MTAVGPITGTRTISPIGPLPAGVKPPSTPEQEALYDSCKQFEGVFVKQLVSGWMKSARGDDAPSGASSPRALFIQPDTSCFTNTPSNCLQAS